MRLIKYLIRLFRRSRLKEQIPEVMPQEVKDEIEKKLNDPVLGYDNREKFTAKGWIYTGYDMARKAIIKALRG